MISIILVFDHIKRAKITKFYMVRKCEAMLTYSFENKGNESLYEYLYKCIKNDILSSQLSPKEKLPSKRAFAKHLGVSTITVENAYNQLLAEGYIYSKPKSGFYVSSIVSPKLNLSRFSAPYQESENKAQNESFKIDLVGSGGKNSFPFKAWSKLMRETMLEKSEELTVNSPSVGVRELRNAIADYLYEFRGMHADPECIIIGAGTEYLYSLVIQLLGREKKYAVEDPGHLKISRIYKANNVSFDYIPLDRDGVDIKSLELSGASVLHISPSHHFPTGIVTPVKRRYEYLLWAEKEADRYIIEDDYDSEFRFSGKPIPTLQSADKDERVIYMSTFSKSLSSTIRISYMVLPTHLMARYKNELSFYSCTVSNFEQYTLAAFIEKGFYEKHINRMRNYYRSRRDELMNEIKSHPLYSKVEIKREDSGLHFLMKIDTDLTDEQLILKAKDKGLRLSCLSQYCHDKKEEDNHTLIINYSSIDKNNLKQAVSLLFEIIQ